MYAMGKNSEVDLAGRFYTQHVNAPVIAGESPQHRTARFVTTGRGLVPESTAGANIKHWEMINDCVIELLMEDIGAPT